MDEVQTGGGATGRMWCHEHFGMPHGPDLVTFSKKMLLGGIYHNDAHRPAVGNRVQNTWMGDPHKIIMLKEVVGTIKDEDLLALNLRTGAEMLSGLRELEGRHPGLISTARGRGTFCAVDAATVEVRYGEIYAEPDLQWQHHFSHV